MPTYRSLRMMGHFYASGRRYLSKSVGELPSLPVPPLKESLQTYLRVLKPILPENTFQTTSRIVQEFGLSNGEGSKLQSALETRYKSKENWVGRYVFFTH